ncbi:MAG: hypothetical protein ACR2L8_01815, partial [Solirubrobacteraceae bacterium]
PGPTRLVLGYGRVPTAGVDAAVAGLAATLCAAGLGGVDSIATWDVDRRSPATRCTQARPGRSVRTTSTRIGVLHVESVRCNGARTTFGSYDAPNG